MGWGYWKYPTVPMVDSWKWFDPRRMTNICERWSKDHTNALQYVKPRNPGAVLGEWEPGAGWVASLPLLSCWRLLISGL